MTLHTFATAGTTAPEVIDKTEFQEYLNTKRTDVWVYLGWSTITAYYHLMWSE